ncbi:TldD/PmbA family protein [Prochlorococcus sp. MIT 1341]|uniref:TldD/PmbA family protein n=1 Tax=Prochlorococcus sp. MIT 1341 TaxID=3096221 RepID=UPI002A7659BA|nr:TldD/PmbA family protein [Prochlorococcus sp. MIT 1341]
MSSNSTDNMYTAPRLNVDHIRSTITSLANKLNINKWDLGATVNTETSVQVDHGESKQLKSSQRNSITVRVWNNQGLVGITSTSDISTQGLDRALKEASKASILGNVNEIPNFSPLCKSELAKIKNPIYPPCGIKRLLSQLKLAESELLSKHSSITSVPYNGIGETNSERIYMNSENALRYIESSYSSIYLYALTSEENRKPRSSGAIRLANGFNDLDINGCINEAAERTISHLNYSPIATGKYLICFTPEAFLDLIGAFSNIFNARSILDGVSISNKNSLGKTISVPFLSIIDNPLHPSHIGASTFDGEGTPTKKLSLINSGRLDNFIHSETTARIFGDKPTGHAGLGAKVSVGIDWLEVIGDTNNQSNELSFDIDNYPGDYVLVESLNALHSGIKASQGAFSLPFDGWMVKSGERISIEAATIAGDIKQVLKEIICVEESQKVTPQGICPHVWVSSLSITGEA